MTALFLQSSVDYPHGIIITWWLDLLKLSFFRRWTSYLLYRIYWGWQCYSWLLSEDYFSEDTMKDTLCYEDLWIIYSARLVKVNCFIIRQVGDLFEILILTSFLLQRYHLWCLPLIFGTAFSMTCFSLSLRIISNADYCTDFLILSMLVLRFIL